MDLSWLTGGNATEESDTERDGFLSYSGEVHAVGMGATFAALTVITGEPAIALFFALVLMGKAKVSSGHLRDAAKESAYSGVTFVVVYAAATVVL